MKKLIPLFIMSLILLSCDNRMDEPTPKDTKPTEINTNETVAKLQGTWIFKSKQDPRFPIVYGNGFDYYKFVNLSVSVKKQTSQVVTILNRNYNIEGTLTNPERFIKIDEIGKFKLITLNDSILVLKELEVTYHYKKQ